VNTRALAIIEIEHAALHNAAHSGSLKLSLRDSRKYAIARPLHMMLISYILSFRSRFIILIFIFTAPSHQRIFPLQQHHT